MSVNGGWYRRSFGNQTLTVDNRYNFANGSYDGPFCANAPLDPNLPGGGGYQVCGLYDLKPSVVAQNLPASSTIRSRTTSAARPTSTRASTCRSTRGRRRACSCRPASTRTKRIFDQCNLVDAGIRRSAVVDGARREVAEVFPDGTRACHQDLPYRPDLKLLGSYTLPLDIQLSGTYQFTRGVQTGGAGPSILATWTAHAGGGDRRSAVPYSAGGDDQVGEPDRGRSELRQRQPESARPARVEAVQLRSLPVPRRLRRLQPVQQRLAVHLNSTFSTAATSNWLRPTNVLQARFFKIGAQFDF